MPTDTDDTKDEATFFKEEVERMIHTRYGNMTVYATIGALEAVKANLLERLGRINPQSKLRHPQSE